MGFRIATWVSQELWNKDYRWIRFVLDQLLLRFPG
jgi:hypothetical protein